MGGDIEDGPIAVGTDQMTGGHPIRRTAQTRQAGEPIGVARFAYESIEGRIPAARRSTVFGGRSLGLGFGTHRRIVPTPDPGSPILLVIVLVHREKNTESPIPVQRGPSGQQFRRLGRNGTPSVNECSGFPATVVRIADQPLPRTEQTSSTSFSIRSAASSGR